MSASRIDGIHPQVQITESSFPQRDSGTLQRAFAAWKNLGASRFPTALLLAAGTFSASVVIAQAGAEDETGKDPADWVERETGIPVTDKLTVEKCGTCHAPDAKGNLSRISWIRTTPEGWSQAIKRMVKLNGLAISPEEARSVVKYLSTNHGLAPEEAKPVMYLAERRILDETIIPNQSVRVACASCHAFAQPMSSRRSHREWGLLQNMHRALYSQAERQYDLPATGENAPGDDTPVPKGANDKPATVGQVALAYITKAAPLHTPEWTAWSPRIRAPMLTGKWVVSASMPGYGRLVGEMTVAPSSAGAGEFTTTTVLRSLKDGTTFTRKGTALVYTGFSWRGTSQGATRQQPGDLAGDMRETMLFSSDQSMASGRWYWGEYQEFGLDVTLSRATGAPVLALATPDAIKTGTSGTEVHLYGAGLPADLTVRDVDFGKGVSVRKVISATPGEVVLSVDVAADATTGLRDISLRSAVLQKALPVYSNIDYLKVTPETSLAHLGGLKYGKGYSQFSATGWSSGPDGKPGTDDDFAVRAVDATWSMEELPTVTYDDDTKYVGTLDATGLFTPNVEGPNPERRFMRNNYGEVWIVATAKTEKDARGKPLTNRAYLVTTVPAYKRWDQPEVSQ